MTILKVVESPDNLLRQKSKTVTTFGPELESFISDMFETMYHESGAGLAAVQVGHLKRIFITDISRENTSPLIFINPEITYESPNKIEFNEGCLSFPGGRLLIERPEVVTVKYQDVMGETKEITVDDWLSRAVQHENDHLDGVLLVDYVSKLKADILKKKVSKHQKARNE